VKIQPEKERYPSRMVEEIKETERTPALKRNHNPANGKLIRRDDKQSKIFKL